MAQASLRTTHAHRRTVPRCWCLTSKPIVFADADYAELLALYLGDGHIVRSGRTYRLRLFLDARYPGIVTDARDLLKRSFHGSGIGSGHCTKGTTAVLSVYSSHLPCLFPQHGPGRKHERVIELELWQRERVAAAPWAFLRGCIRSDGCAFVNRTGPYEYLSYEFYNLSDGIRDIFMWVCQSVGVRYRVNGASVRIYRRESVSLLERHVGAKA